MLLSANTKFEPNLTELTNQICAKHRTGRSRRDEPNSIISTPSLSEQAIERINNWREEVIYEEDTDAQ